MSMTSDLLARLERHYIKPGEPLPGGIFIPECGLDNRRIDALYVGFTSTRGHHMIGHELKVSRADWMHELDQADKADRWARECHAWYMVAPSVEIVRPEELPYGWGLMIPGRSKTRMDVIVKAKIHVDREPSWTAVHSILKRVDTLRAEAISEGKRAANQKASAEYAARVENEVARRTGDEGLRRRAEDAEKLTTEISEILGLTVGHHSWQDNEVSVDEIRNSFARWVAADKNVDRALNYRLGNLKQVEKAVREARKAVEKINPREGRQLA